MILSLEGCIRTIVPVVVVLALMAEPIVSLRSGRHLDSDSDSNANSGCGGDSKEERFACGELIMLEDFAGPQHAWTEMNDPVMGGKSIGSFMLDADQHLGVFHGSVEIVSFLHAPGFIKAETTAGESWPDVSTCEGLQLIARSSTPDYKGFRLSFGHKRPPHAFPYIYGFKTNVRLSEGSSDSDDNKFVQVKLPFDGFTDNWDAGSGDAIVTCKDNKEYCPDADSLKDLYSIAVWGEGVKGEVDLQIQSISAYGCKTSASNSASDSTPADDNGIDGVEDSITIENFSNPTHEWRTMNDPVMGGRSESSVTIHDGMASFEGTCAIVPFLHAPGFITLTTGGHRRPSVMSRFFGSTATPSGFPDVSGCEALSMKVRSRDATSYDGYYVSFGTDRVSGGHHAFGYKTHFAVDPSGSSDGDDDDFADVVLPFSSFSSHWDEATGHITVTCADDPSVCPTPETLRDMKTMSFWAEGVEGTIALDIRHVGAVGCGGSSPQAEVDSDVRVNTNEPGPATAGVLGGGYGFKHTAGHAVSFPCIGIVAALGALALWAAGSRGSASSLGYTEVDSNLKVELTHSDLA